MPDFEVKVEPTTFQERLKVEHQELLVRVQKLNDFIDTTPFYALTVDDQTDLKIQYNYMTGYVGILARRLNRLSAAH